MVPRITSEPDQLAVAECVADRSRVEVTEPGVQGQVRRQRLLCLQPDQVVDEVYGREPGPFQQVLAMEERSVENAWTQLHPDSLGCPP